MVDFAPSQPGDILIPDPHMPSVRLEKSDHQLEEAAPKQAVAQRQRHGSIPGRRQDDFKIALAIEGGSSALAGVPL